MTFSCTAEYPRQTLCVSLQPSDDLLCSDRQLTCKQVIRPADAEACNVKFPHPLLRFCAPSADSPRSPVNPGLPHLAPSAHGLSQTFDGFLLLGIICLVSCRYHSWGSKSTRHASDAALTRAVSRVRQERCAPCRSRDFPTKLGTNQSLAEEANSTTTTLTPLKTFTMGDRNPPQEGASKDTRCSPYAEARATSPQGPGTRTHTRCHRTSR